jgi:hypothetical protein
VIIDLLFFNLLNYGVFRSFLAPGVPGCMNKRQKAVQTGAFSDWVRPEMVSFWRGARSLEKLLIQVAISLKHLKDSPIKHHGRQPNGYYS